jgi:hypothetical protein
LQALWGGGEYRAAIGLRDEHVSPADLKESREHAIAALLSPKADEPVFLQRV